MSKLLKFLKSIFLEESEDKKTETSRANIELKDIPINQQNQQFDYDSPNYRKERLKFLTDEFRTLMSKPFPNKRLNPTDPFFDEFYTVILKIREFDASCGNEKKRQLENKIEAHNNQFANNLEEIQDKKKLKKSNEVATEDSERQRITNLLNEELEKYLNAPVFNDVLGCSLNDEQKRAVLCDSKYNLVLAENRTGKTLTICGKIKYLLENKLANEEDILVLSYLNTSVDELKEKLSDNYPNLVIKTFHSLGFDILTENLQEKKAVDDQLLAHIKAFFDEKYYKNIELRDNLARYLSLSPKLPFFTDFIQSSYLESVDKLIKDFKSKDFKILSEALKCSRGTSKRILTIKKESVKSLEELMIANYLFVNGIKYEYEKPYEFKTATPGKRQYCPDFFLPDYGIYIEHFGIDKTGHTPQYSADKAQEYHQSILWKEEKHDEYNTICVKTYSYEFSNGKIFVNLKNNLEKLGVKFKQRWTSNRIEEMKDALLDLYWGKDLSKLIYTLEIFLRLYKSQYRNNFTFILNQKQLDGRERLKIESFRKISKQIDDYCVSLLEQNNKIDFDDMILQSTKLLDSSEFSRKYRYKYILVDDFHDTTQSIFDFLEKLVEHGNSKLMAVGDNRQAVDRFKDSDIGNILDLKEITFPNVVINKLTTFYKREDDTMEMLSE